IQDKRVIFPKPDPTKFTLNLMLRIKRPPTNEVKVWIGKCRLRYDPLFLRTVQNYEVKIWIGNSRLRYGRLSLRTVQN
ncbi:hypothetical protein AVEN_265315-1, partial [Araneus ventricosus]